MKNWLFFLGGIVTGVVFVLGILFVHKHDFSNTNNKEIQEKTVVKNNEKQDDYLSTILGEVNAKPGKIINETSFKVFQVHTQCAALVCGKSEGGGYYGTIYLLVTDKYELLSGKASEFYDDQIVKVPKGKVVGMFGTHKYTTRDGRIKTVPRIMIVDK